MSKRPIIRVVDRRNRMPQIAFVCLALALLSLLTPNFIQAQVDHRIDYRASSQGRLYDANNRIGGSGLNYRNFNTPFQFDAGFTANNIVVNNVTGLGGFRGFSPIPAPNAFRENLPSSTLSGFRGQSFDLTQIRQGQRFGTSPYYDPSDTVADLGLIRRNVNMPASSTLRSPYLNADPSIVDNYDRDRLLGVEPSRRFNTSIFIDDEDDNLPEVGVTQQRVIDRERYDGRYAEDYPSRGFYSSITQSAIFGSPGQLAPKYQNNLGPNQPNDPTLPALSGQRFDQVLANEDKLYGPRIPASLQQGESDTDLGLPGIEDDLVAGLGTNRRPLYEDADSLVSDDDLFRRMVAVAKAGGALPESPVDRRATIADKTSDTRSLSDRDSDLTQNAKENTKAQVPLPSDPKETSDALLPSRRFSDSKPGDEFKSNSSDITPSIEEMLDKPLKSFVAGKESRLNRYLKMAEDAQREGKFFDAAQYFEMAISIDNENPLPYLGRGHALAAAGNYLSAVNSIESGIKRFPDIAKYQLDLPALVGQSEIFDRRRRDLEEILKKADQYELRFLLGYLELYSGLQYDGMNDLERAAKQAPPGGVIARFPDLLLGRETIDQGR